MEDNQIVVMMVHLMRASWIGIFVDVGAVLAFAAGRSGWLVWEDGGEIRRVPIPLMVVLVFVHLFRPARDLPIK
jgi:hypothetical protein